MSDRIARRPPGPRSLLARILDEPELVRAVQSLPPRALGKLIDRVGLEDAGELVALATAPQLEKIFDEDLWRGRPGESERFDPERFALWLEVMLEGGDRFAAERFTELPEDLVTLAFHKLALVIDLDALALELAETEGENDAIEKALDGVLAHEVDQYRVMARGARGGGARVQVLCALDRDHHDFLQRLLERSCHATREYVEAHGGLEQVLTSDEVLESDAAGEREERRAALGYVPPADATAFLRGARETPMEKLKLETKRDPITAAYFRRFARAVAPVEDEANAWERLREFLVEEAPAPIARRITAGERDDPRLLQPALDALRTRDPQAHAARADELGYLANLLAAAFGESRALDAAEAVLVICELGLRELGGADLESAIAKLRESGVVPAFRIGWNLSFLDGARRTRLLDQARALRDRLRK